MFLLNNGLKLKINPSWFTQIWFCTIFKLKLPVYQEVVKTTFSTFLWRVGLNVMRFWFELSIQQTAKFLFQRLQIWRVSQRADVGPDPLVIYYANPAGVLYKGSENTNRLPRRKKFRQPCLVHATRQKEQNRKRFKIEFLFYPIVVCMQKYTMKKYYIVQHGIIAF